MSNHAHTIDDWADAELSYMLRLRLRPASALPELQPPLMPSNFAGCFIFSLSFLHRTRRTNKSIKIKVNLERFCPPYDYGLLKGNEK